MAVPPATPTPVPGRPAGAGQAGLAPLPIGGRLLPLRRLTVADVLDGAYRTFRAVLGPAALVVLVIMGPLLLVTNLALSRIAPGAVGGGLSGLLDLDPTVAAGSEAGFLATTLLSSLVGGLLSLIAAAAVVALVLAVDRGEADGLGPPLRVALKVLVPTMVASVLLAVLGIAALVVALVAGVVLLIIPLLGLVVFVLVLLPLYVAGTAAFLAVINLVVPVAVVERTGPLRTLGRSLWVFTRQPIRIVWISLLVGVGVLVLSFAVQLPFLLLSDVVPAGGWVVESLGEVAGQLLTVPVTATAALLLYLDTRVRVEAVDLRVRARGLAGA